MIIGSEISFVLNEASYRARPYSTVLQTLARSLEGIYAIEVGSAVPDNLTELAGRIRDSAAR